MWQGFEIAWANFTVQAIAYRVLALLIIAGVHGLVIAATAVLLGDKGPKYDGRLTVSPASHVDLVGAAAMVLFGMGWAKPVAVDAREFRTGALGIFAVILAGFVGLLALAELLSVLVLPVLETLPQTAGLTTAAFLRGASRLTIWFALLSLVPIPPLTAGMLLGTFGVRISERVQWVLTALIVVAIATGVMRAVLRPVHAWIASIILGT